MSARIIEGHCTVFKTLELGPGLALAVEYTENIYRIEESEIF